MAASPNNRRLLLSNVPGRDDDVEDVHMRTERELRRRIRESDPTYTQKRLDANRNSNKNNLVAQQQQQQQQQPQQRFGSMTQVPTPEQAVLDAELANSTPGPRGRNALTVRQNAVHVYPVDVYGQTRKPSMARWKDVANDSDVATALRSTVAGGAAAAAAAAALSPNDAARGGTPGAEEIAKSRRPTFMPDSHLTQLYARRCCEVASKTAAIRYRDVCNAKSADDMGALGVDPELMGNFTGGGAMDALSAAAASGGGDGTMMFGSPPQQFRRMSRPILPDNYHGVPTRGDSDARLIAYRRMKSKDKLANAQRSILDAQLKLATQREMEEADIPFDKDADSDGDRNAAPIAQYAMPESAQDMFDDCAVYLKDSSRAADPGFPLAMRLGTVDSGSGLGSTMGGFTGSGIDFGQTDNEDLVILTTPQLRLASKCVLQCIFSLQAADLRADTVPTIPMLQFVPVRQCPMFVQNTHTLMMHDLKARLRKGVKTSEKPSFVCWTRVLLSRSGDPEDDVVAADDVHVQTMAHANELGFSATGRTSGSGATMMSPGGSSHQPRVTALEQATHPKYHFGGTLQPEMMKTDALITGAASVDMMVSSPAGRAVTFGTAGSVGSPDVSSPGAARLVAVNTAHLNSKHEDKNTNDNMMMMSPASISRNGRRNSSAMMMMNRNPPAIPVLVRAPRPILVKPAPRHLFYVPPPTSSEIASEFREFSQALRPLLDQPIGPPGASRDDPDRMSEGADVDGDGDLTDEEIMIDEQEEQMVEEQQADGSIATKKIIVTKSRPVTVRRPRRGSAAASDTAAAAAEASAAAEEAERERKKQAGAAVWETSRRAAKSLSMDEIYEPMNDPTIQQMEQLLADSSPFTEYETAAMTARAIVKKLRQIQQSQLQQQLRVAAAAATSSSRSSAGSVSSASALSGSSSKHSVVLNLDGSDGERLRFRLFEALDFIKQFAIDATSKLTRASSQVEFRFKMQEGFLSREVETSGFANSARGIINADQRVQLLEERMESGAMLELMEAHRQAVMKQAIEAERVARRSESARREQQQSSPPAGLRHTSPMRGGGNNHNNSVSNASAASSISAHNSPTPPRSDSAHRSRLPEPVVLRYAKRDAEDAPESVSNFIASQRDGAQERPPAPPTAGSASPKFFESPRAKEEVEDDDDAPALIVQKD